MVKRHGMAMELLSSHSPVASYAVKKSVAACAAVQGTQADAVGAGPGPTALRVRQGAKQRTRVNMVSWRTFPVPGTNAMLACTGRLRQSRTTLVASELLAICCR
jgi:hypothetical protein